MIITLLVGTLAVVGIREILGVILDVLPWSLPPSIAPIFWILVVGGACTGFLLVPYSIQLGAGIFGAVGIIRLLAGKLTQQEVVQVQRGRRIPPLP